jgi:DNA-binding transcriptional LysR family regulator
LWQQLLDGELDALIGCLPADGRLDLALCSVPVCEDCRVLVAGAALHPATLRSRPCPTLLGCCSPSTTT